MENLGSLAILLALCVSLYGVVASVIGRLKNKPFLLVSGQRAIYSTWVLMTLAAGILVYSLMTGDFRFAYVAAHSNRAMPTLYKFAAWWGGQEGSLLFWGWLLSTYALVVAFTNRRRHRDFMPWVLGILGTVQTFFLILNNFIANPFQMLASDKLIVAVPDGNGLSPLLQYPAMAIHPPMLYLGYVGFTVPFAFAIASLITRQPGEAWIHTTRRWTLVTWLFQSTGVMLGAIWAYHVLGWGGYWGWDPVENASLLPWLSGTAFLHSVMMQEKKGMMKVWNIVLISATFFLCILGTFLTRSGIVQSVHAFARSEIGKYFVTFLAIGIAATIFLILDRLPYLKSESQLESVISRESSFLFNNLILLASCFAVLWGTLFPVISEAATGDKISLDTHWYNRLMVPIGLFLLLLTGVGPLFAWRRTSADSLRRNFQYPGIASLVLVGALFAAGVRHFYALISFGFCLFVALTVIIEFFKGGKVHRGQERHEPAARHDRVDPSQHAPLRRVPGPHGHRPHVHRLHRRSLQPERSQRGHARRHHEDRHLRPPDDGHAAGRERQLPVAPRRHGGLEERRGARHPRARKALLHGEPSGHIGSRHPPADRTRTCT